VKRFAPQFLSEGIPNLDRAWTGRKSAITGDTSLQDVGNPKLLGRRQGTALQGTAFTGCGKVRESDATREGTTAQFAEKTSKAFAVLKGRADKSFTFVIPSGLQPARNLLSSFSRII
jgi:hypothetical protein